MELDLNNFNIRKTKPIILGNAGLPDNVERYTAKAEGILGIDVFEGDEIKILNIEGSQELELTFFNDEGLNKHAKLWFKVLYPGTTDERLNELFPE